VDLAWNRLDTKEPVAYDIAYGFEFKEFPMTTITATDARKKLYGLLDDVATSHEPIQIAGKRNTAVLISQEDWRAVQETLYLVSIPGLRESIREGLETPVDQCDTELTW
jgi:antitoxin YefM